MARLIGLVLGAVVVVGLVMLGARWLADDGPREDGGVELIRAPDEPYKVRPEEAGGMEVEGQGDSVFAASAGDSPEGRIDPRAVPEEPMRARRGPTDARDQDGSGRMADAGSESSPAGAAVIELGAFTSGESAGRAWTALAGRYAYLEPFGHSVARVESGDRATYRLRVDAGSADRARTLCARLRVAQEACSVVAH